MQIIKIPVGAYAANCYLVYSETTKDGIVVDPGGNGESIGKYIKKEELKIDSIVLTHGHGDHIGGVSELKEALRADVMIHKEDVELLNDGDQNLSSTMPMGTVEIKPDRILVHGDIIEFGNIKAEVIHTPGHTKGGISLKIGDNILTGDTLFAGSIGRTDFPGGDYNTIIKSIKEGILIYPEDIKIHPGHGEASTIGREKTNNPFLK